ncbi:hypothetical protein, partial [Vibrio vulnificus]|uniref:hypothetical protein n=1 Tax=Vibrio vulnificus TaxID=672 RepID=UPI001CC9BC97
MASTFLGGAVFSHRPSPAVPHRKLVITASVAENVKVARESSKRETENGRREMLFAAVAAAVCSVSGVAAADYARGTPEAKKAYAPV